MLCIETHHRDTERTEEAQRNRFKTPCFLRVLCASVVNGNFYPSQVQIDPLTGLPSTGHQLAQCVSFSSVI